MKIGWAINSQNKTVVLICSAKESKFLKEIIANLKPNEVYEDLVEDGVNVTKEEITSLLDCLYKGLP